jgi:ATP-dependent helicase Lhr and Lhr-like helicase
LPWPSPPGGTAAEGRRAARVAGAFVVLVGAEPACYVEASGKGLVTYATGERLRIALVALADAVRAGRVRRLELERVDGEPVLGSAVEPVLMELGFRAGPRRLSLSA